MRGGRGGACGVIQLSEEMQCRIREWRKAQGRSRQVIGSSKEK